MGYIRGVVHGTVIGTVVGICIAPQQGKRTREQLSAFGTAAKEGYGLAGKTVHSVAPFASAAFQVIRNQLTHGQRDRDAEDYGLDDNVRVHQETNGHSQN
jgi:gas vesicle protein